MLRTSARGYLGAATPAEFIDAIGGHGILSRADAMPCHMTVDYDDPNWRENLTVGNARQCAGQATYLANTCKRPKGDETAEVGKADHGIVFSHRMQFMEHHEGKS